MIVASIAPYTSHRLSPLYLTLYRPVKGAFSMECGLYLDTYVVQTCERCFSMECGLYLDRSGHELAEVFNKAYLLVVATASELQLLAL
jgi:hypothetical protein